MYLCRLLYRSDAALLGSPDEVEAQLDLLIKQAKEANEAAGLTGALLLASGIFMQVLEGPGKTVESTFERICRDLRHRRVRLLELAAVESRSFGDWSMARVPLGELRGTDPLRASAEAMRLDATMAGTALATMRTLLRASRPLPELQPAIILHQPKAAAMHPPATPG